MLAVEVAQYLHDRGKLAFDPAGVKGNTFVCLLPATPDQAVMIEPMGGIGASGTHGYDNPVLHLLVRGTRDPRTGFDLAQAIYDTLHGLHDVTLPGGTYVVNCLGLQSGPINLGPDANSRLVYSLNFQLEVRNQSEHRM